MTTDSTIWKDVVINDDSTQDQNKIETLQPSVTDKFLDETSSPTPILSKLEKQTLEQQNLLKQAGCENSELLRDPFTLSMSPERRQRLEEVFQRASEKLKDQNKTDGKDSLAVDNKEGVSARKEVLDKPLKTQQDIANEANKLNDYANKFLSGSNEDQAFKQWTDELNKLANSNDVSTVKKVFQKIADNNSGANPLLNSVTIRSTEEGGIKIYMSPSAVISGLGSLNHRQISASVESNSVFTHAFRNDSNMSEKSAFKRRQ